VGNADELSKEKELLDKHPQLAESEEYKKVKKMFPESVLIAWSNND
jgi:hypothetical protein